MTANKTRRQLMSEWTLNLRENGLMEIICPHGIGHPSKPLTQHERNYYAVHGCDGCCGKAAFKAAEDAHLAVRAGK